MLSALPALLIWGQGWEAGAAARIEQIRKADLRVVVRDARGRPVPRAGVRVQMKRHAFGFGTAVAAEVLLAESPDAERYRKTVLELFNKVVLENDLKWPQWERNRRRALDALGWLRAHGITDIRGHNLVWPGWKWLPPDLPGLASNPADLAGRVNSHIAEEASAVRGLVTEWDVVNEPYSSRDLLKILGDEVMAEWFRKAREADPGALLYINDFSILSAGGADAKHQDYYYNTIKMLDRLGAPVQGIGMQGHFNAKLTPPARVLEILDRFAKLGKRIQVTEFDIDIDDQQLQAKYTRDFLTAVFSHPAVDGFLMWGFWEGRHWRPRGAMYRRDWSPKPNAEVFRGLVFHEWWTNAAGETDADGVYATRGFLGEYEIEVSGRRVEVALPRGGREVSVVLR
ncbi:MAG: endo-1,4-beta-xylanase [Bryobacteraceae bacterium]